MARPKAEIALEPQPKPHRLSAAYVQTDAPTDIPVTKRDIRHVLSLKTLKTLEPIQLDILSYKLMGYNNSQISRRVGLTNPQIAEELCKKELIKAKGEAEWNIRANLLTAADVAAAAEAEILTSFYQMALSDSVPHEFRLKYGQTVLDYRLNLLKIAPAPSMNLLPPSLARQVLQVEANTKTRMQKYLETFAPQPLIDQLMAPQVTIEVQEPEPDRLELENTLPLSSSPPLQQGEELVPHSSQEDGEVLDAQ